MVEILKALEQTVFCAGDLHGACFHTLGPVFAIFHGSFLQVFQTALGFKRLDAAKMENTYKQAGFSLPLVLTECKQQVYNAFVNQLSDKFLLSIQDIAASNPILPANWLAISFLVWFDNKLATSTDEVFVWDSTLSSWHGNIACFVNQFTMVTPLQWSTSTISLLLFGIQWGSQSTPRLGFKQWNKATTR